MPSEADSQTQRTRFVSNYTAAFPLRLPGRKSESTQYEQWWTSKLNEIASESDLFRRSSAVQQLASDIPDTQLPAVLERLVHHDHGVVGEELRSLLVRQWAERSPEDVATWSRCLPENTVGRECFSQIALGWATSDLLKAAAWVQQLPANNNRTAAQLSLGYEASGKDLYTALSLATSLLPGKDRDQFLNHCVRQWAAADSDSALTWASQTAEDNLREQFLALIAVERAETEKEGFASASSAVIMLNSGRTQNDAVVGVVQRWAQKAPEQAAAWVEQFEEGSLRVAAMENLAALWAQQDLATAGDWLNRLVAGHSRDAAIKGYVSILAESDSSLAFRWAQTIQEEALRLTVLNRFIEPR